MQKIFSPWLIALMTLPTVSVVLATMPVEARAQSGVEQNTLTQNTVAQNRVAQAIAPQRERVLSVTGVGTQSIPTALSQINLGVEITAATANQAQEQAAQAQTAVIEWLRSQNVEQLETTGLALNPTYEYQNDRQVLRGYSASNTISFKIPTEAAGSVIDGAIAAGATRILGISFVATDSVIAAARQSALASAVADAQQQADTVLETLGLSRREVVSIVIGSVSESAPAPRQARLASEPAVTPVVGQTQTVSAQVTLEIRY